MLYPPSDAFPACVAREDQNIEARRGMLFSETKGPAVSCTQATTGVRCELVHSFCLQSERSITRSCLRSMYTTGVLAYPLFLNILRMKNRWKLLSGGDHILTTHPAILSLLKTMSGVGKSAMGLNLGLYLRWEYLMPSGLISQQVSKILFEKGNTNDDSEISPREHERELTQALEHSWIRFTPKTNK